MDTKKNHPLLSKIDQLVDDAKTELNRVGIETGGKRSDEILKMAREARNKAGRQAQVTDEGESARRRPQRS